MCKIRQVGDFMTEKTYICENILAAITIANKFGECEEKKGVIYAAGNVFIPFSQHLVRLFTPTEIDSHNKIFKIENLPIIPNKWEYTIKAELKKSIKVIEHELRNTKSITVIGSPSDDFHGRVRSFLEYLNTKIPVNYQVIISYENEYLSDQLKSPTIDESYSEAYKAKERVDWLYGINASAVMSLAFDKPVRISRTKIPLLKSIIDYENLSMNTSNNKYGLTAYFRGKSFPFRAEWLPNCDTTNITNVRRVKNYILEKQELKVINLEDKEFECPSSPPFTYTELLIHMFDKHKIPLEKTDSIVKSLYFNGYITYPFSFKMDKFPYTLKDITDNLQVCGDKDLFLLSKDKDTEIIQDLEFGIYPTPQPINLPAMDIESACIYKEISKRLLEYMSPPKHFIESRITIACNKEYFKGIKVIEKNCKEKTYKELYETGESLKIVPPLSVREITAAPCEPLNKAAILKKASTQYIAEYNILAIINELIRDRLLISKNGNYFINEESKKIIPFLPDNITSIAFSKFIENCLSKIKSGEANANQVIRYIAPQINSLLNLKIKPGYESEHFLCPVCNEGHLVIKGSKIKFYGCTAFPQCKATFSILNNLPLIKKCPKCEKGFLQIKEKNNSQFFGCSNYPNCHYMKPIYKGGKTNE